MLMLSEDAELREVIIELGGLLTLAVESEEESLLRQALNVVADGEVEPIEITLPSPLGERFVFYKLKDIVEKLSSDIMTGEEKKIFLEETRPHPSRRGMHGEARCRRASGSLYPADPPQCRDG